jgi:MFS family permease
VSDVVPNRQRGLMSGLLGASITAAIVTGVLLTRYTTASPYLMFLVPWALSPIAIAFFVWVVPDSPAAAASRPSHSIGAIAASMWISPARHPDFAWAFLSRLLVFLAIATHINFQVFYLTDHLHIAKDSVAQYMSLSTSMMGVLSLTVSSLGGWISDRMGVRKPFVGYAAVAMAAGMLLTAYATTFDMFLGAAALVYLGYGLYYAVDIALCVAVLPNPNNAAKDLAILNIANSLPQVLAPLMGSLLLNIGSQGGSNYFALFAAAFVSSLLGALAITPIRGSR